MKIKYLIRGRNETIPKNPGFRGLISTFMKLLQNYSFCRTTLSMNHIWFRYHFTSYKKCFPDKQILTLAHCTLTDPNTKIIILEHLGQETFGPGDKTQLKKVALNVSSHNKQLLNCCINVHQSFFIGRNEVLAKVIFLQACVCPQGGVSNFSGGVWSPIFWGGVVSNFLGGWSPIFGGVVSNFFWGGWSPIFRGGGLQFFGGGWSSIFRGGLQLEYGQRLAGTHPTGMHSCYLCAFVPQPAQPTYYLSRLSMIHVLTKSTRENRSKWLNTINAICKKFPSKILFVINMKYVQNWTVYTCIHVWLRTDHLKFSSLSPSTKAANHEEGGRGCQELHGWIL